MEYGTILHKGNIVRVGVEISNKEAFSQANEVLIHLPKNYKEGNLQYMVSFVCDLPEDEEIKFDKNKKEHRTSVNYREG